jgi:microcin C transport system ATP-binding protein
VLEPKLLLLDEPTSALDVSIQKQVLALLRDLQRRHHMSYLFISHDLKVVRAVAHRVIVMREGKVVESGATEQIFSRPQHEYTRLLLSASLLA